MTTIVGPTLPEPYYGEVERVWKAIEEQFGDNGISNPYPHVTLYGLELTADLETLESRLESVAATHGPVPLRTDGVGVFPGDHVWIPVARTPELDALHRDVLAAIDDLGTAPTPYYDRDRWFPHVGLGLRFDSETVGEVVSVLREREDFAWELTVDNLEVTRRRDDADEFERVSSIDL